MWAAEFASKVGLRHMHAQPAAKQLAARQPGCKAAPQVVPANSVCRGQRGGQASGALLPFLLARKVLSQL